MLLFKKIFIVVSILFLSISFGMIPTWASVQIDGQLKANKTCEALLSIRMGTNPGNIRLRKGKTYQVIGKDRNNESHYLIKIPDENISPSVRWIAKNCGKFTKK